uniref:Uncharacterized protein n=1 Tax=Arundo donax TaxID=35708 RepID=A0A0A9BZ23_ARUDO
MLMQMVEKDVSMITSCIRGDNTLTYDNTLA